MHARFVSSKGVLAIPSRVIAASFALTSFAAAALAGIYVGNAATTILWRATLVMIAAWFIGLLIGSIAQRVVALHVERHKHANPIPQPEPEQQEADSDGQRQDQDPAPAAAS